MSVALGAIVIGQGILLLVAIRVMRTFGAYAEMIVTAHQSNLLLRQKLAVQENELAIREVLHQKEREA